MGKRLGAREIAEGETNRFMKRERKREDRERGGEAQKDSRWGGRGGSDKKRAIISAIINTNLLTLS